MRSRRFPGTFRLQAVIAVLAIAVIAPALGLAAETPAPQQAEPSEANITFWNRHIATLHGTIGGADPQMRAEKVVDRLNELPLNTRASDITTFPLNVDGKDGVAFSYHGKILFYLGVDDPDAASGQTLEQLAQATLSNLDDALQARCAERSWPVIRSAVLFTLTGLFLLIIAAVLIWKAHARLVAALHHRVPLVRTPLQLFGIDLRPPIDSLVYAILKAITWILVIAALYSWTKLSLARFPYTQPWSDKLGGYVLHLFQQWGRSTVDALPGLLAVFLIVVITRWIVQAASAFFEQVVLGRIRVSWLDPDVAHATQRIFTGVAWVFAAVVAYPYIPGSGTEAFKGISVFLGLMISLGSTGIINQVMSGLFVVYSRALKTGEWVQVNDIEGEVLEVGLLAGKIRSPEGQEITVPNSVLVSTSTKNFTRLGMSISAHVTIGYDAPWRQVESLLLIAADRTANIRKEPKPFIRQRQLSDFYVDYLLVARIQNEKLRLETLSNLHAQIQDAFNEYGVQIMSPHYMMQPEGDVVVPRSKWNSPPAAGSQLQGKAQAAAEK
ncbi:MAG TPA: mechanosensitive ion channel domain-containing protein [Bryocella sp.]|nr:mechanosensitive ion channel domain-containing protein [Bryocella sp.]